MSTNVPMNIIISCDISGYKVFYYPITLTEETFVQTPK